MRAIKKYQPQQLPAILAGGNIRTPASLFSLRQPLWQGIWPCMTAVYCHLGNASDADLAGLFAQASESLDKLRANLREEHILKMDWTSTLFRHVGPSPSPLAMLNQLPQGDAFIRMICLAFCCAILARIRQSAVTKGK